MRLTGLLLLATLVPLSHSGCGGGGGGGGPSLTALGGTAVSEPPSANGIVPFSQIRQLSRGTPLRIRLNRAGLEVREYSCFLLSAFTEAGDELIACQLEAGVEIALGDSGAPIYTVDSQKVGAVAFGTGDQQFFLARSRAQMESLKLQRAGATASASSAVTVSVTSTAGVVSNATFTRLPPSYVVTGLTTEFLGRMNRRGRSGIANRIRPGLPRQLLRRQAAGAGNVQPGSSISINLVDGELLRGGAIGTVTDVEGNTVLAFAHELDRRGLRALPVSLAFVDGISSGPFGSLKLAHPEGGTIGALTNDRLFGVRIDLDQQPVTIPIKTIIRLGNNPSLVTYNHQVAPDNGSLTELDLLVMALIYPVEFARNQTGGGSADFTFRITRFDGGTVTRNRHVGSPSDLIDEIMSETVTLVDAERVENTSFGYVELAIHLTS